MEEEDVSVAIHRRNNVRSLKLNRCIMAGDLVVLGHELVCPCASVRTGEPVVHFFRTRVD